MTYLDHAATTPVLPSVVAAVAATMGEVGNASSLHGSGRAARRRVEESRESIAGALGARPSEVVVHLRRHRIGQPGRHRHLPGAAPRRTASRRRILIPALEHHAVLDTVEYLATTEDAVIGWLEVDDYGRVHADTLAAAIAENPADVALISVMWANNEVGTVNPVRELAEVGHRHGIPLHTDAVQAVGASSGRLLPLAGRRAHASPGTRSAARSASADCCCAGTSPSSRSLHGGGQERGVRSGTLDVAGIVGLATAVTDAVEPSGRARRPGWPRCATD